MKDDTLAVGDSIKDQEYEILELLGKGNSGEVYRLTHPRHGNNRVVKLFIPFYELKQARLIGDEDSEIPTKTLERTKQQEYQQTEYEFLSRIDHPFIVKVHEYGAHTLNANQRNRFEKATGTKFESKDSVSLPIIIAAYVEGQSLSEAMSELSRRSILRVIRSFAEALDYIHQIHNILHRDIKSSNVRVRPDGYPILLDFALSLDLSPEELEGNEVVKGGMDWELTPALFGTTGIRDFVTESQSTGVSKGSFRDRMFPWLDYYQTGLMLHKIRNQVCNSLTPAEAKYFNLLVDELSDWNKVKEYDPGCLYDLVRRIDATQFFLAIRPGSMSGGKEISLSSNKRVFVPPKFVQIVDHPELTRLNRLNQLSLLSSEFAGATHSRYEHALDVFRLSQSAARRLLDDPLCRRIFDESDVEMLMVSSLLHDINHVPLTHLFQEAGVSLLRDNGQRERDLFLQSLNFEHSGHETLGRLVAQTLEQDDERLHRLVESKWETQKSEADQVISSLINSGVDLDKISYLRLDSEGSGLGFAAGIDSSALLAAMHVVEWDKFDVGGTSIAKGYHIAFPTAALPLLEAIVMARTRAFRDLYWCNENRAMMAQFLGCVRAIAAKEPGRNLLDELIVDVRGETDFEVLNRLDKLSEDVLGHSLKLSSLFDSISGSMPTLVYSSQVFWDKMRMDSLGSQGRLRFEEELSNRLNEIIPSLGSNGSVLMVDVPERSLHLGGDILVVEENNGGKRVLLAESMSPVIKAQIRELEVLSKRVRIFVSGKAAKEWKEAVQSKGRFELEKQVGAMIEEEIGQPAFR